MKRLLILPILAALPALAGCNSCGGWFANRHNDCCETFCEDGCDTGCSGCAGGFGGEGVISTPSLSAPTINTVPGTTYVPGPG